MKRNRDIAKFEHFEIHHIVFQHTKKSFDMYMGNLYCSNTPAMQSNIDSRKKGSTAFRRHTFTNERGERFTKTKKLQFGNLRIVSFGFFRRFFYFNLDSWCLTIKNYNLSISLKKIFIRPTHFFTLQTLHHNETRTNQKLKVFFAWNKHHNSTATDI